MDGPILIRGEEEDRGGQGRTGRTIGQVTISGAPKYLDWSITFDWRGRDSQRTFQVFIPIKMRLENSPGSKGEAFRRIYFVVGRGRNVMDWAAAISSRARARKTVMASSHVRKLVAGNG